MIQRICLVVACLLSTAIRFDPAFAGRPTSEAEHYRACISLTERAPEEALESAFAWRDFGGGVPARHCAALALVAMGRYRQAATRLELLAREMAGEAGEWRADVLAQAGNAWLLAGEDRRATAAFTLALSLAPEDPDLLIDRARASAASADFDGALADLDRALALDPTRIDAMIYRAAAWRHRGDRARALEDVELALALDPSAVDGLIERGILRRLAGDGAAARADWLAVLHLAPDTPAARAAKRNLERLDVKVE